MMNKVNLKIVSDFAIVIVVIMAIATVLKLTVPNTI